MTQDEIIEMAVQANAFPDGKLWLMYAEELETFANLVAAKATEEALAQPEQEPVAWLITDEKINSLQVDSIQRLIDRARHANMTDIKLRINGQDEWHQVDWLKHLTRTTPPQRTGERPWVSLTDDEIDQLPTHLSSRSKRRLYCTIEAKLKEKNT